MQGDASAEVLHSSATVELHSSVEIKLQQPFQKTYGLMLFKKPYIIMLINFIPDSVTDLFTKETYFTFLHCPHLKTG